MVPFMREIKRLILIFFQRIQAERFYAQCVYFFKVRSFLTIGFTQSEKQYILPMPILY